MSVNYSIQPMKTRPGQYFMRVEHKGTRRRDQIIANIASKTGVGPVDVAACLDAIDDEWMDAAVNGEAVIFDDFLGGTLSIEAGQPITDPNYSFTPPGDRLVLNAQVKRPMQDRARQQLPNASDYVKVTTRIRQPQINQIYDVLKGQVGSYSPGGPIEIRGVDLDLPADLATDTRNGVYFKVGATETRATIYMSEGDLKIVCIVPSSVTADSVDISVRSDYESTALREGTKPGVPKILPTPPPP